MMFRAPTAAGLPPFSFLLADMPCQPELVARHLNISPFTLQRYKRTESAPRAVMLSLFWESRWGRSAADSEAANYGAVYYRQAKGLERANAALADRVARLQADLAGVAGEAVNGRFWA